MQLFAVNFILFYCTITLHVSGVVHTHTSSSGLHKTVTAASGTGHIPLLDEVELRSTPSGLQAVGHVAGR